MRYITKRKQQNNVPQQDYQTYSLDALPMVETVLPRDLNTKAKLIDPYIKNSVDIKKRFFTIAGPQAIEAMAVFIEGIVDGEKLIDGVLTPLMLGRYQEDVEAADLDYYVDRILRTSLTVGGVIKTNTLATLIHNIYDGLTVILIDGFDEALVLDIRGGMLRAIDEPNTERTLRGSREGFVENLVVNISMVRRKLRDPNMIVEKSIVGKRTRTDVAMLYIQDIADPQIVNRVRNKINNINIEGVLASGYIEQLIEDHPYSLFPQARGTERPDKMVAFLLEGRVGIIVNGTPFALVVPSLFVGHLQATEDYNERFIVSSLSRFSRWLAFFIAVSLPPLYLSLVSFQPEIIPFQLLVSLAMGRAAVPFTALVEVLLQEIVIQFVIESGIRLPSSVAQTIGVVGGIILGQAAIAAHLLSPAMILVVAVTTIATFTIPSYSMVLTTRILRLPLIALSAVFGIFGFSLGWLMILTHMVGLDSQGVPYLGPLAPTRYQDLGDTLIRKPIWAMKKRAATMPHQDDTRQS